MKRSLDNDCKSKQLLKLPNQLKVNEDTYEWVKVLGKGGYAVALSAKKVSSGKSSTTANNEMVAIKCVMLKDNFDAARLRQVTQYTMREIDIMNKLDHPNIVKLYSHLQDQNCIYLILELCVNKTLASIIKSDTHVLSNIQIRQYLFELAQGCKYMHDKLVLHRDLKGENCLLDQQFRVKIADFGLSVMVKCKNEQLHTFCGTLKYQAPEMINRQGYSFGVDVWALGCIGYRLYYGNAPFDGQNSEEIYRAILTKAPKYARTSKSNDSIETYEISVLKSMLHKDPSKRITVDRLLEHKKYFGAIASSGNSKPTSRNKSLNPPVPLANNSLDKMVACLEAISNFEPNKRIRISYTAHHDSKLMPKHWITEWVDVNLFGFGYLFNKNIYGFNFKKDHSQMLLLNGHLVMHLQNDQLHRFQVDCCPAEFTKNLNILKQTHSLLIEQIEQEHLSYPEMDTHLPLDNLPWLEKKLFIGGAELVAMAFHLRTDLIQLTFVENQKIFLFDANSNSMTIIKNDKSLCLGLQFILDGHVTEAMQTYVTECLKYIHLLLNNQ